LLAHARVFEEQHAVGLAAVPLAGHRHRLAHVGGQALPVRAILPGVLVAAVSRVVGFLEHHRRHGFLAALGPLLEPGVVDVQDGLAAGLLEADAQAPGVAGAHLDARGHGRFEVAAHISGGELDRRWKHA